MQHISLGIYSLYIHSLYTAICFAGQSKKTEVKKSQLNPEWNEVRTY